MPDHFLTGLRSLRTQLMLWNALAVAATGLLILLALRAGVRPTLIADLDEVLSEDLMEIKLHFEDNHAYDWSTITEELNRKAEGHEFHLWFVQFYDEQGQPTWSSKNTPNLRPFTADEQQKKSFAIDDYRLSFSRLDRPLKEGTAVCVGCSQRYISRDMATIDRLAIITGLIVLLISPVVGHFLTGKVIGPLAQMIRTTARLHPGEFGERLPIRDTGDELDSLARTINGLLDRIATYLQQEHDFLANAAHDLRTPLAAIQSSVEVALAARRSDDEYREILHLVIEQCSSLQTLVNQLLLLAESGSDRLHTDVEPVSLDQIVARVVAMFEGVAEDHRIDLRCSELSPISVPGNRHHLWQVASNLLDNAIKFTAARQDRQAGVPSDGSQRGCITVELIRDEVAQMARLRVRDNGIGIAKNDQFQIFDRFFRGDRARVRDGVAGGTGLGLSICKAIVEAHNGTITVESQPGHGATFTVSLPFLAPDDRYKTAETPNNEQVLELP